MSRKDKAVKIILLTFVMVLLFGNITVNADTESADELGEQAAQEVWDSLPESAQQYLNSDSSQDQQSVFGSIWASVKGVMADVKSFIVLPAKTLGMLVAIVSISALLSSLNAGSSAALTTQKTVDTVVSLAISAALVITVIDFLSQTKETIMTGQTFTLSFIPVLSGLMVSSGEISSATFFAAGVTLMSQVFTSVVTRFISPLNGILLGFSAVGGISDSGIAKISPGVRKAVTWVLGVVTTAVVGIMNLQTNISASSDSLALKTGRYMVGSTVPVIGASVSEALSTVSSSLKLARSGVGTVGIAGITAVFLPIVISGLLMGLALAVSAIFADLLGQSGAARTIRSVKGCIDINVAVLVSYYIIVVFSTAAVISVV